MDDLIIWIDTFSDHLFHLKCVFERVREAELTLNPKKCEFGSARLEFLGNFTGSGQVRPLQRKWMHWFLFLGPPLGNSFRVT